MTYHYVCVVVDGGGRMLRGPFQSKLEAEQHVEQSKQDCLDRDLRTPHYGFGTVEFLTDQGPGIFDKEEQDRAKAIA